MPSGGYCAGGRSLHRCAGADFWSGGNGDRTDRAGEEKQYRTFGEIFKSGLRKIFPNRRDSVGEGIRKTIADIAVLALIGCGVYFGVYAYQSHAAKAQQQEIEGQIITEDTGSTETDVWAEFFAKYPNISLPDGMMSKYAYLYAINQDLVGFRIRLSTCRSCKASRTANI